MNQENYRKSPENTVDRSTIMRRRFGAAILSVALTVGLYGALDSALGDPHYSYSAATTEYTLKSGEGTSNAAAHVEGVGSVDIRDVQNYIEEMPANVETLSDGLQNGETLVIPESVTP